MLFAVLSCDADQLGIGTAQRSLPEPLSTDGKTLSRSVSLMPNGKKVLSDQKPSYHSGCHHSCRHTKWVG